MAHLTPIVHKGMLTTHGPGGTTQTVALDEKTWLCWLRQSGECCFRFLCPLGVFGVRCEKSKYWHSECRYEGRNYKVYLGKAEQVTLLALYAGARKLYERMHGEAPPTALLELIWAEETATPYREATTLAREASALPDTSQTPAPSHSSDASSVSAISLIQQLTPREREVLQLLASGLTNPEIAAPLDISVNTVKMHLRHIYYKLSVASRAELIAHAKQFRASMPVVREREEAPSLSPMEFKKLWQEIEREQEAHLPRMLSYQF